MHQTAAQRIASTPAASPVIALCLANLVVRGQSAVAMVLASLLLVHANARAIILDLIVILCCINAILQIATDMEVVTSALAFAAAIQGGEDCRHIKIAPSAKLVSICSMVTVFLQSPAVPHAQQDAALAMIPAALVSVFKTPVAFQSFKVHNART